jgi:hypothetical protein
MKKKDLSNTLNGVLPNFKAAIDENEDCDELGSINVNRASPPPIDTGALPQISMSRVQSNRAADQSPASRRISSIFSEPKKSSTYKQSFDEKSSIDRGSEKSEILREAKSIQKDNRSKQTI